MPHEGSRVNIHVASSPKAYNVCAVVGPKIAELFQGTAVAMGTEVDIQCSHTVFTPTAANSLPTFHFVKSASMLHP